MGKAYKTNEKLKKKARYNKRVKDRIKEKKAAAKKK